MDQIFIANASYLGSYGNASNTVVFPLTVVALALAVMVGDGCCAFVSISLGKGENGTAKKSVGNSVVMILISSLVLTAIYLIFAEQMIALFGGTVNEETFRHSKEYFFYITLAGAIINIILDPIFIFICKWGMMGAAVATVAGQAVTAILSIWYLLRMKIIKPAKKDFLLNGHVCGRTLGLGITSFLSQISLVAAMAAGCIPIVGFNMGAGKKVAEELGIPCYDSELIHKIAQESGFAESYIKDAGEYAPSVFFASMMANRAFGETNEDYLWEIQQKIIVELAEKKSCVIVGRYADYILRDKADCLKVFVHASMDYRAERIVKVYGERCTWYR